jgi:hypothetical protein
MPSWLFWALFFATGIGALAAARWLDNRERRGAKLDRRERA